MSERIFKAVIDSFDNGYDHILPMQNGAEILSVGAQRDTIAVWYRCDATAPMVDRRFVIRLTGDVAPPAHKSKHIGTVIFGSNGDFIVHVFEKMP